MNKLFKTSIILLLFGIGFCCIDHGGYQLIGLIINFIGFFLGVLSNADEKK